MNEIPRHLHVEHFNISKTITIVICRLVSLVCDTRINMEIGDKNQI